MSTSPRQQRTTPGLRAHVQPILYGAATSWTLSLFKQWVAKLGVNYFGYSFFSHWVWIVYPKYVIGVVVGAYCSCFCGVFPHPSNPSPRQRSSPATVLVHRSSFYTALPWITWIFSSLCIVYHSLTSVEVCVCVRARECVCVCVCVVSRVSVLCITGEWLPFATHPPPPPRPPSPASDLTTCYTHPPRVLPVTGPHATPTHPESCQWLDHMLHPPTPSSASDLTTRYTHFPESGQ